MSPSASIKQEMFSGRTQSVAMISPKGLIGIGSSRAFRKQLSRSKYSTGSNVLDQPVEKEHKWTLEDGDEDLGYRYKDVVDD